MNTKQLLELGIPNNLLKTTFACLKKMSEENFTAEQIVHFLKLVIQNSNEFKDHIIFSELATGLANTQKKKAIECNIFCNDLDQATIDQMQTACNLPISLKAALMPDAHLGYGLPIGGVLATQENTVIPYAVGVDIGCQMRLTVYYTHENFTKQGKLIQALERKTRFGIANFQEKIDHQVMDDPDWDSCAILRELKDNAWRQLGTSGDGNHFVEFGHYSSIRKEDHIIVHGPVQWALLSHSGSRNTGYKIANHYSKISKQQHPELSDKYKNLSWLTLDSQEGQEYWTAMNLMTKYAAACHEIIHEKVTKDIDQNVNFYYTTVHNYANNEVVDVEGEKVNCVVHRKGAIHAGKELINIIPGSMGDNTYIVAGLGNEKSLNSASHGAGRKMSRTEAKEKFSKKEMLTYLEQKGITLLSGEIDEAPMAYKNIDDVMELQKDCVKIVGKFEPKIVRMS